MQNRPLGHPPGSFATKRDRGAGILPHTKHMKIRAPRKAAATKTKRRLAASAVFANSLVDESIEFGAREGDFRGGAFATVAGFRKLRAATGRRSYVISGASGHELGDFPGGEKLRLAGEAGGQHDFGEMLDDFDAVKSDKEIRTAGNHTMIGEEKGIVVRNVGLEDSAEIRSAGRGVSNERNFAEGHNNFGEEGLIESLSSGGESSGGGRMSVTDGVYIRTHLIEEEMHAGFGRNFAITTKVTAFQVHNDEVVRSHHALVEAGGSRKDAIGIEADGEIPFGGDDVAALVHPATYEADITAVLLFRARSEIGQ